jgi:hypothetical protein
MQQANRAAAGLAGRYIYAIIPDQGPRHLGPVGLEGREVYTLGDGKVAAVVSDLAGGRIRPQRRNMAAHQEVLKHLMNEVALLPVAFGLVADDHAEVIRILKDNRVALLEQLDRVTNRVEMSLRVTWDVPNFFEYFVGVNEDLRELRDSYFRDGASLTQDQKISLGRNFGHLLEQNREEYTEQVEAVMRTCCREIKHNKVRSEKDVMNLACLIERSEIPAFEQAVQQAALPFDDNFAFDFNGPWAPHNFVELNIRF